MFTRPAAMAGGGAATLTTAVAKQLAAGGSKAEEKAKEVWKAMAKKVAGGGTLTGKQFDELSEARALLGRTPEQFDRHVRASADHAAWAARIAEQPTAAESDAEQKRLQARIPEIEAEIDRLNKELIATRTALRRCGHLRAVYEGQLSNLVTDFPELFAADGG